MRFKLARLARANGYRRARTTIRPIKPPSEMGAELGRILLEPINVWTAAQSGILAEYTRALAALQTDSASDVRRRIDETEAASNNIFAEITLKVARWVNRVEIWHRRKWVAAIASPTSVDLSTMLTAGDVRETMETLTARNVALAKDLSAQAQSRISDIVFRGLQKRSPARDVAKEINEATGMGRKRALRIGQDQLQKLTSSLDRERMAQAGIDRYAWQHSGKAHPREEHLARDGNEYALGEPDDEPGELPYCGCKRAPILSLDD